MKLVGTFKSGAIPELLKMIMVSGNTAVVSLHSDQREAHLGFLGGELIRIARGPDGAEQPRGEPPPAELDREQGLSMLLDLWSWPTGSFSIDPISDPISAWPAAAGVVLPSGLSNDTLELEVCRRLDERTQGRPAAREVEAHVLIVVGSQSRDLERLKEIGQPLTEAVHVLPIPEDALRRVGYYLLRNALPIVVIDASSEGRCRGQRLVDFRNRLRLMSRRASLVLICDGGAAPPCDADRVLHRPLSDQAMRSTLASLVGGDRDAEQG